MKEKQGDNTHPVMLKALDTVKKSVTLYLNDLGNESNLIHLMTGYSSQFASVFIDPLAKNIIEVYSSSNNISSCVVDDEFVPEKLELEIYSIHLRNISSMDSYSISSSGTLEFYSDGRDALSIRIDHGLSAKEILEIGKVLSKIKREW
ncbi:hypothetical protein KNT64_gp049 [Pseudomonas phage PspYZU05]|uniref:Uncharacterized protein n=1 Tax=Pseudomonas phage PspYZU05 TaxID=1983556 RepID=A0A2U7NF07_9CAUD|nr:hypothetical protein KNT64_gp049 [Pseudomonas phage PspYZU05]ASD52001.1 hypothetical protein PspYZU05_49 [Pseudomonas phage PspYZU05]